MMDDGFDPVSYLKTRKWFSDVYGLEKMSLLLSKLDDPQDDLKFIHVAGTNGKGSTCAYIASILECAGLKVGLYTSPYIETIEERVRINSEMISRGDLLRLTRKVKDAAFEVEDELGEHPSSFEVLTAIAFLHFKERACDVVVLECGLGGRLDATNVASPLACVITKIGLDHTDVLGETLPEIASEKAGIIKRGIPVVAWPDVVQVADVIKHRCDELGCRLVTPDFDSLQVFPIDVDREVRPFIYKDADLKTQLLGSYQPYNAACAIEAARAAFPDALDSADVARGIGKAKCIGRFEILSWRPLVVVDGAHNASGALAFAESLLDLLDSKHLHEKHRAPCHVKGGKVGFVLGVLSDKDYSSMVKTVLPISRSFTVYTPDNPRALDACDLKDAILEIEPCASVSVEKTAADAIRHAVGKEGPEGVVAAFGTLYSIADVKGAVSRINPPSA